MLWWFCGTFPYDCILSVLGLEPTTFCFVAHFPTGYRASSTQLCAIADGVKVLWSVTARFAPPALHRTFISPTIITFYTSGTSLPYRPTLMDEGRASGGGPQEPEGKGQSHTIFSGRHQEMKMLINDLLKTLFTQWNVAVVAPSSRVCEETKGMWNKAICDQKCLQQIHFKHNLGSNTLHHWLLI